MNMMTVLRIKNRYLGKVLPNLVAQQNASMFLSPRKFPMKEWEETAEKLGTRISFSKELSAIRWGSSDKRILLMHGWEGRATQMYSIAAPLVELGYEVIAIDGPKHGQSKGEKANPVGFANAIVDADKAFGPFHGALGHSMGACALAMAYEKGTNLGRYTLIASPACVHDVLKGFAWFMGLSTGVASKFIEKIESIVGRSSKDLDVGRMLQFHDQEKLLVHAKDDLEIPYHSMVHIRDQLKNVRSISPKGLGHRKIMRDQDTIQRIVTFMSQATPLDMSING